MGISSQLAASPRETAYLIPRGNQREDAKANILGQPSGTPLVPRHEKSSRGPSFDVRLSAVHHDVVVERASDATALPARSQSESAMPPITQSHAHTPRHRTPAAGPVPSRDGAWPRCLVSRFVRMCSSTSSASSSAGLRQPSSHTQGGLRPRAGCARLASLAVLAGPTPGAPAAHGHRPPRRPARRRRRTPGSLT